MTPEKYSGIPIFFVPTILRFWKKLATKRSFGYFKKIPELILDEDKSHFQ